MESYPTTTMQAYKHSKLALEATESHSKAEAHQIHAGILKDMGQLDEAEKVPSKLVHMHILLNAL